MNDHFIIRKADRADYPAIGELCLREGWKSYARDDFGLALDRSLTVVGVVDGEVVAFARALSDGYFTVFVCELIVAEEYRKRGFGRQMLDFLHDLAPSARTDLVSEADGFYEAVGFRKVGTGYRKTYHA